MTVVELVAQTFRSAVEGRTEVLHYEYVEVEDDQVKDDQVEDDQVAQTFRSGGIRTRSADLQVCRVRTRSADLQVCRDSHS